MEKLNLAPYLGKHGTIAQAWVGSGVWSYVSTLTDRLGLSGAVLSDRDAGDKDEPHR